MRTTHQKGAKVTLLRLIKLNEADVDAACAAYVEQIRSVSQPLAIYLFGSLAEGRGTLESDIDLLSIYPNLNLAKQAERLVWRQKSPYPIAADLIFIDFATWRGELKYSPLVESVKSDGKLLYQSDAYQGVENL